MKMNKIVIILLTVFVFGVCNALAYTPSFTASPVSGAYPLTVTFTDNTDYSGLTNIIAGSTSDMALGWTGSGGTLTWDSVTKRNGSKSAKFVTSTYGDEFIFNGSIPVTANKYYVFSVYARGNTRTACRVIQWKSDNSLSADAIGSYIGPGTSNWTLTKYIFKTNPDCAKVDLRIMQPDTGTNNYDDSQFSQLPEITWKFGDGSTSSEEVTSHTYYPGSYSPTLVIGSDNHTNQNYIVVSGTVNKPKRVSYGGAIIINAVPPVGESINNVSWYIDGKLNHTITNGVLNYSSTDAGYHNITYIATCDSGLKISNASYVMVDRKLAGTDAKINELGMPVEFDKFTDDVTTFNVTGGMEDVDAVFSSTMGGYGIFILFALPILFIWINTKKLTMPTAIFLLFGWLVIGMVPPEFHYIIWLAVAISFSMPFVRLLFKL